MTAETTPPLFDAQKPWCGQPPCGRPAGYLPSGTLGQWQVTQGNGGTNVGAATLEPTK